MAEKLRQSIFPTDWIYDKFLLDVAASKALEAYVPAGERLSVAEIFHTKLRANFASKKNQMKRSSPTETPSDKKERAKQKKKAAAEVYLPHARVW